VVGGAQRTGTFTRRGLGVLLALVVAGGVALGMAIPLGAGGPGGRPALAATPVTPIRDAPPIAGRDVEGVAVAVPAAGRPALVTFLAASCSGGCAARLDALAQGLGRAGDTAGDVDVVAVSVAPEADRPAAVNALLARYDLQGRLAYVIGTRADLEPVWRAWGVAAPGAARPPALADPAPVVLVDAEGRQVGTYRPGDALEPGDLAGDVRALAEDA
jgi:protein SCO1/2